MTPAEADAITGLLDAIGRYLGPRQDIGLACAAVCGQHLDAAAVAEFTALLGGTTGWTGAHAGEVAPNHVDNAGHVLGAFTGQLPGGFVPGDCITCHGHVTPDGVFHPAVTS